MRRNSEQAHEIRPVVDDFAPHYFPANICCHLTSGGANDDKTRLRSNH